MAQSIEQQLHQYIDILNASQKKSLLGFIKSVINFDNPEENRRLTIEEYNRELEEAEADIEAGNYYTIDEVKQNVAEELKKYGKA